MQAIFSPMHGADHSSLTAKVKTTISHRNILRNN